MVHDQAGVAGHDVVVDAAIDDGSDTGGSGGEGNGGERRGGVALLSMGGLVGLLVVAFGLLAGASRLHDNSFLTHLATGRLIWDSGIPRSDPYSFTASGEPWVVQSWLVSVLFGGLEELGGLGLVRLAVSLVTGALALLVWKLTAACESLLLRIALVAVALASSLAFWGERPLMVGLLGFALCVLAATGRLDPRWLLPVGWVWANSHGSFPLGVGVLVLHLVGAWADREDAGPPRRSLLFFSGGLLLGAANPLGPRLLWFPIELLGRSEQLRSAVYEWRPPTFDSLEERAFLVLLLVAVVALVLRPRWRAALPLVVFGAAALVSRRNIPVAVIALLPALAAALPPLGTLTGSARRAIFRPAAVALGALAVVLLVATLRGDDLALDAYPVEEVEELAARGVVAGADGPRLLTPDFVGNYLEFRYGTEARVFIDDRYDMYPEAHVDDYVGLVRLSGDPEPVLDRHGIDAVLWSSDTPLGRWLDASPDWEGEALGEDEWALYCPRGSGDRCG